jgi:hypothetical protein
VAPNNRKIKGDGMTEIRPGISRRVRARLFFIALDDNADPCINRKLADLPRLTPHAPSLSCGPVVS